MLAKDSVVSILLRFFILLIVPDLIYSQNQPFLSPKRYGRSGSMNHPAYVPMSQRFGVYQVPEYDENYIPMVRTDDEYDNYMRYSPNYGYYSNADTQNGESYGYVLDQPDGNSDLDLQQGPVEGDQVREFKYPYGEETWFEGDDGNAETNSAFIQNLMMAQMYQDGAFNSGDSSKYDSPVPYVYAQSVENYAPVTDESEDIENREYSYGIPVLEENEKENEDESVRELESLRKPLEAAHTNDIKARKTEMNKESMPLSKGQILRNLRLEKQMRRSNKKDEEIFPINKKRFYNIGNYKQSRRDSIMSDRNGEMQSTTTALPTTGKMESSTGKSPKLGQKEYVLPRPANPVRSPLERDISTRSVGEVSVYNTIKKLLAMEEGLRKVCKPIMAPKPQAAPPPWSVPC